MPSADVAGYAGLKGVLAGVVPRAGLELEGAFHDPLPWVTLVVSMPAQARSRRDPQRVQPPHQDDFEVTVQLP